MADSRQQRLSVSVTADVAGVYRCKFKRYGFRSMSAMMSAALVAMARMMTAPDVSEGDELGDEVAREFAELSDAESHEWGVVPRRKPNRYNPG